MTNQPWTTARKLAEQRIADLRRQAQPRRRVGASELPGTPGRVALGTARLLVTAGWRLGGTKALPSSLRRVA